MLAAAVAMPPHARVNSQCYPIWNADRSDLRLVWRGQTYAHGFHAFGVQPDGRECLASGCVQRLFCTDSGAAGWYGAGNGGLDVPLAAAWLGHAATYRRTLSATEGGAALRVTSQLGPGTLAVAGSTLFFYAFAWSGDSARRLPRLSSLVFAEWRAGARGDELVAEGLRALNVLGCSSYRWFSYASPLYASGPGAITLSTADWTVNGGESADRWAVDAVVYAGARGPLVHYLLDDCPSVAAASREVATFPRYSCRAAANGSVRCAVLGTGRYTWARGALTVAGLGAGFAPLRAFALPDGLWLHAGVITGAHGAFNYTALVGFGHAPALGVAGDALVAVEARDDASCASGSRLHLVTRALPGGAETAAEALGCEWRQVAPAAHLYEPAYGALAVKWAGAWSNGPLLTAVSLVDGVYHLRGARETETGDPSTEHAAWGASASVVTLRTAEGALRCPALGGAGVPDDAAVAAGSAQRDRGDCVRALVPRRVGAAALYADHPLLAYAGGAAVS